LYVNSITTQMWDNKIFEAVKAEQLTE